MAAEADRALKARAAVASTLVAGLELVKGSVADVGQVEAFGTIRLQRVEGDGLEQLGL